MTGLALVAGMLVFSPTLAAAQSSLDSARARLAAAQAKLDQATAAWQSADARLATTRDELAATQAERDRLLKQVAGIRLRLQRRVVQAFENGPGSTLNLILSSTSFAEFSDRMEFLANMEQSDSDLVVKNDVITEQLRRAEQRLAGLSRQQTAQVQAFQSTREALARDVASIQQEVDRLRKQARLAVLLGLRTIPGAPISTCPVQGANSFVDSFGWPRPGGRVHEGIDIIAAYGTPIVAVQPGNAVHTYDPAGGNGVIVYGPGGDYTYYAHMSSYGAVGSVSVGTITGFVGSTGDATTSHLHFEYHPGGGAAVDPYLALLAVC
jgi:murein DD-endopeptidase MepM/ murein hydrolase activator NlpD